MEQVTILLPVRNGKRYLPQTLSSLAHQSFARFELIAVDDGSADGSAEILHDWAAMDPRIRVVQAKGSGLVSALNEGLTLASFELIARADADDLYHPDRLQLQFDHMQLHPEEVLLGARTIKIDSEGRKLFYEYQALTHDEIVQGLIAGYGGVVPHPVVMFRKSAVLSVGGYRTEALHCEDLDLWLRLADLGRLANLPNHLIRYRVHPASVSATHWRRQRLNIKKISTAWARKHALQIPEQTMWKRPPQTRARLSDYWARQALHQGNVESALRYVALARLRQPLSKTGWRLFSRCLLAYLKRRFFGGSAQRWRRVRGSATH